MTAFNRRHFLRHKEKSGMKVFLTPNDLNRHKDLGAFIPVKMCNKSEEGLYIETDRAFTPGLNVSIKMIAPEDRNLQEAYYVDDGRVVWCKKIADDTSRFGVGVKVLRKVIAADVLTSRFR